MKWYGIALSFACISFFSCRGLAIGANHKHKCRYSRQSLRQNRRAEPLFWNSLSIHSHELFRLRVAVIRGAAARQLAVCRHRQPHDFVPPYGSLATPLLRQHHRWPRTKADHSHLMARMALGPATQPRMRSVGGADTRTPLLLLKLLDLCFYTGDEVAGASLPREFQGGFQVGKGFTG